MIFVFSSPGILFDSPEIKSQVQTILFVTNYLHLLKCIQKVILFICYKSHGKYFCFFQRIY